MSKTTGRIWLQLLPYIMLLLPLVVLNLGFHFLATIELHWEERIQGETALQELEALTRSSSVEYRLNRASGSLGDKIEAIAHVSFDQSISTGQEKAIRQKRLAADSSASLSELSPQYKIHIFRKSSTDSETELLFAKSNRVESRRAMAMIFDYMVDQHREKPLSSIIRKQRDKLAESYFGKTASSEAFARSQKGRTSTVLHEGRPHWFLWDYREIKGSGLWGWFILTRTDNHSLRAAQKLALTESQQRMNGLAGFVPVVNETDSAVLSAELEKSQLFKSWCNSKIQPLGKNLAHWLEHGPPEPARIGNYKIYTYMGKDSEYLTLFLAPAPRTKALPAWLNLLNIFITTLSLLLSLRGLLLGRWINTNLTLRFMILYFLAATFPLGMLAVTAAAYHYQASRSAQNQIAVNLEGCLKQIETRKMQIQEEYQSSARQMFADPQLAKLIDTQGTGSEAAKKRIVEQFYKREAPLPLLGFYLLDIGGKGTHFAGKTGETRLKDIFGVYRAAIIQNLRRRFAISRPDVILPEFAISEEETFGSQAFATISGNPMRIEIEKRRNFCLNQQTGEETASLIYDFILVQGIAKAMLFLVWDSAMLFEESLQIAFKNFRVNFPDYSFIAYKNTPQGLKTLYRTKNQLAHQGLSGAMKVAETAAARGGTVTEHQKKFSVVAMPFGQNSEIVIAGISGHSQIAAAQTNRSRTLILLILVSLIIAALCAYFTAAFLLTPIGNLKTALDRVSRGDYSVCLSSDRADELGNLTREFARMAEGLKERERIAALLSDHAIEALVKNTETAEECDARAFSGIALVADIRNFTGLCEVWPTDDITEMLNHHFAAMSEVISANGGHIYKFIGDAIEAVFEETDAKTAAINAAKTAVEMHLVLGLINEKRKEKSRFTYEFGVGLAQGMFYAGSVGSEDTRLDYSIIGEGFHKAAQLEALTKQLADIPVAFDNEIASLLTGVSSTRKTGPDNICAHTFADSDSFVATTTVQFAAARAKKQQTRHNETATTDKNKPISFFQKNYLWLSMALFTLLIVTTAYGIYQGFSIGNLALARFNQNKAAEKIYRLLRQIKSEDAEQVAFTTIMEKLIVTVESEIKFKRRPGEANIISEAARQMVSDLQNIGIKPAFVFATTDMGDIAPEPPQVAMSVGLDDYRHNFYHKLAHFQLLYYSGQPRNHIEKQLDLQMNEFFGAEITSNHFTAEKIGISMPVEAGTRSELHYWNFFRVYADDLLARPLPDKNYELSGVASDKMRIAGIIMCSINQKEAQNNPGLLVEAYSTADCEIALISKSGERFCRKSFPQHLLAQDSSKKTPDCAGYLIERDEIKINQQNYQLLVVSCMSTKNNSNLTQIALLLLIFVGLALVYFYRSVYIDTTIARSVQNKLVFSILLTALVPMLTVAFISDYFIFENHQAMVQQQRLELKRFIDAFEVKQYFVQPIVTRQIQQMAKNPRILELARKIEQNPDSQEDKNNLKRLLAEYFTIINAKNDWESNVTSRDLILVGRHNLNFRFNSKPTHEADAFSSIISQTGQHILACISEEHGSDSLSMKNLKSELYFDGAMQSIRSNFGDRAYIRLTNAINQLVEFEVTTGAAGMVIIPLPSIDEPEFLLLWLISFSRGLYMARIADHNRGAYAVFSIEYHRAGKLNRRFNPVPGLNLAKEAAWVTSSNLPVSSEKTIKNEKITVEARPGSTQLNSFIIGAAAQTPIDKATRTIKNYLYYFMVLAIVLFILIGFQTASDIMMPVKALSAGMRQIDQQNYFYRIGLDRSDELGQLCTSYDRFAKGLAEKEVMGKMLSRSAKQAMTGNNEAAGPPVSNKSEFVLMFIGSTDFSQQLSGDNIEELFRRLKAQVAHLCQLVVEMGGDIDKLMGDKILGVFAVSANGGQSARKAAIKAACRILQAEEAGELHFPVAIGVNFGIVISGILGFGNKRDFTVIGDAVNVSARIEKEAEKMPAHRCLFSQDFVSGLDDDSLFKLHSEAALKGKATTLKLYRLS